MNLPLDELRIEPWVSGESRSADLVAVLTQSHGIAPREAWLQAKFTRATHPVVAALAFHEDRVVGIVAFGLNEYTSGTGRHLVAISYDTFVSSEFRGRGLFMELLATAEQLATEAGAESFLNFPNSNSRRGFANAGWRPLSPLYPFVSPTWRLLSQSGGRLNVLRDLRSHPFIPADLSAHALEIGGKLDLHELGGPLSFRATEENLASRFARDRGTGYATLQVGKTPVVVRVGTRGSTSEVQIMHPTKLLQARHSIRAARQTILRMFEPEVVSFVCSTHTPSALLGRSTTAGFLRMPASSVPYFKGDESLVESYCLSGVDVHTW